MIFKAFVYLPDGNRAYRGHVIADGKPEAIVEATVAFGPGDYDAEISNIDVAYIAGHPFFKDGDETSYDGRTWISVAYQILRRGWGIEKRGEHWVLFNPDVGFKLIKADDFDEAVILAGYYMWSQGIFEKSPQN